MEGTPIADNFPLTPGTGRNVVTKQISFSGDTADIQLCELCYVTGTEGAYTLVPAAALTDNTANPTVLGFGSYLMVFDGSTWDRWQGGVTQSGNWSVRAQDGAGNALTSLAAGAERSLTVAIVDGAGVQITSFGGGGTQYTAGDVDASITGNAILWEDSGNTLRTVAAATPLPVAVIGTATVSVTGTVDTELPSAAALTDNFANPTAPAVGAFVMVWDGTTWDRAPGTAADGLLVNLGANNDVTIASGIITSITNPVTVTGTGGTFPVTDSGGSLTVDAPVGTPVFVRLSDGTSAIATLPVSLASVPSHAVTNAGTFAVQVDGAALTALQLIDDPIFTDDNAFTPASGKVHATGFFADESAADSVDEGDIGIARMTLDRKQHVVTELESNAMRTAGTAQTPKYAAISTASSGNTTVVAAVASRKIRVLSYRFQGDADVSVKFRDNTAGVDLTGAMATGAKGGGGGAGFSPVGHFETASGNALSINLSGAVQVSGHLTYIEVP